MVSKCIQIYEIQICKAATWNHQQFSTLSAEEEKYPIEIRISGNDNHGIIMDFEIVFKKWKTIRLGKRITSYSGQAEVWACIMMASGQLGIR